MKKSPLKYDVIVAGTGFASTFFLHRFLSNYTNAKILVLEKGNFHPHKNRIIDVKGNKKATINWSGSVKSVDQTESIKPWVFEDNFGGGSNCWTGCTPRFMPNDFKLRTSYNKGIDWPISYEELEHYYTEAEELMSIAGPEKTPFIKSKNYPLPPHALSSFDLLIQKKYPELYISQPTARPTRRVAEKNACCSSSACNLCPVDAKFTIENSYKNIYDHPNVEIQFNSQVYSVIVENNNARGVAYLQNERDIEAYADLIVLGCNAIFNAHILLNSGDTSPFLGKGLSEQAGTYAFFYLDNFDNVGGGSIIPANGYMLYDLPSRQEYSGCLIESHNTLYIRAEFNKWRHIAKMKFIFEDLPSEGNYITTSSNMLKPKLIFKGYSKYVTDALEKLETNVENIFSSLPIEKIHFDGHFQKTEFHICGTTRMSTSPADGVLDKNQIHHRYRNLVVLGSGSFPTVSPANPTLTISALALKSTDALIK